MSFITNGIVLPKDMNQSELFNNRFKESLRNTFRSFVDYLNSQELNWWCAGGTCIGAVRHHDIIPWDDDIDIFMPRKDYNILLAMEKELRDATGLELLAIQLYKGYNHTYAKVINSHTTIWEQKEDPTISGSWIDIFVLDNYDKGEWAFFDVSCRYKSIFIDKYQSIVHRPRLRDILSNLKHGDFYLVKALFKRKQMLDRAYNCFLQLDRQVQSENGVNYASYTEGAFVYNKKWFDGFVEMPFGDFQVRVPIGYDDYLTYVYGDYMTPPNPTPAFTHSMYYVNLKERLSIEEAKQRIKNGETQVY